MARSALWPYAAVSLLTLSVAAAGCGGGGGGGAAAGGGGELTSHLAGDWWFHGIVSGPGEPWSTRGRLTVTAAGATTGRLDFYGDPSEAVTTTMSLSADRVWTLGANPGAQGAVDLHDRLIAYNVTQHPGGTEMGLAVRMAPSYATSDLAGTWEMRMLAAGDGTPYWGSAATTIAADGSYVTTLATNTGGPGPGAGLAYLSPDGVTTLAGWPTWQGALDALKTVMVSSVVWVSGTKTELWLSVKLGSSYAQGDLAGTWRLFSLASGPGEPWWERGSGVIDAAGQFTGSTTESDGSAGPKTGTFTLSPDGHVSIAGSPVVAALDAGKTVMTWVDTWGGTYRPGTTELKVLVKVR
jgi:hypothetical protein